MTEARHARADDAPQDQEPHDIECALLLLAHLAIGPYRRYHLDPDQDEQFWLDQVNRLDPVLTFKNLKIAAVVAWLRAHRGAVRNLRRHKHGSDQYNHWLDHAGVTKRDLAQALETATIDRAGWIVAGLEKAGVLDKATRVPKPENSEGAAA